MKGFDLPAISAFPSITFPHLVNIQEQFLPHTPSRHCIPEGCGALLHVSECCVPQEAEKLMESLRSKNIC